MHNCAATSLDDGERKIALQRIIVQGIKRRLKSFQVKIKEIRKSNVNSEYLF